VGKANLRPSPLSQQLGQQRDWIWQGWQTRYTYLRPAQTTNQSPIIFIHGFGASLGHWRQNLPFFAQHHTVYALDLLGFGASEKAAVPYSVDLWVQQLHSFWKTFIDHPVILVGNSIGSLVALAAAHAYPEMAQGLVMLSLPDPSLREDLIPQWCRPVLSRIERAFTAEWILKSLFYGVRRPKVIRPWAGLAYASRTAITDELVEILTLPAGDRGAARAFSLILQAMVNPRFGPRVSVILPTLDIPILLLWGRQDRMVPPMFASKFAAMNPRIQLVELDDAGHCPHDECAERVNGAIADWLCDRVQNQWTAA
jgi:pimeloyl-ACP methyl ester carboxylesterase